MFKPYPYQQFVIDQAIDHLYHQDLPGVGLFLDCGLGKTAISLSIVELLKAIGEVDKTLVVAPLRVCHSVWPVEIEKHGFDLTISIVHGPENKRIKQLGSDADIYVTTPGLIPWLQPLSYEFDLLICDESTKFKGWGSQRSKALRKMLPPKRIVLTGTPSPDSLADLHPQIYLLDEGHALGATQRLFRSVYMRRGGYEGREWYIRSGAEVVIQEKIAPLVIRLDAADHIRVPEVVTNDVWVDLPERVMREYRKLLRELVMELESGEIVVAANASSKYLLARQLANGGAYEATDNGRVTHHVHNAKTVALEDVIEECHGKPLICFYQFRHDLQRLKKKFSDAESIHGGMNARRSADIIQRWNHNKIKLLLCQPQSMGHGLNLQHGTCADICWFGLPDSLEVYQQANARLDRQGQTAKQLRIHRLLANGTVDQVIRQRIESKDANQQSLLDALKEMVKGAGS
jgi:SNF2 family DNA or RNA helicase